MRSLIICATLALAALLAEPHAAAHAAWCGTNGRGSTNCGFSTREQCMAWISGSGGFCNGSDSAKSKGKSSQSGKARTGSKKQKQDRDAEQKPAPAAPAAATAVAPAAPAAAATTQKMPESFIAARDLILRGQHEAGLAAMQA